MTRTEEMIANVNTNESRETVISFESEKHALENLKTTLYAAKGQKNLVTKKIMGMVVIAFEEEGYSTEIAFSFNGGVHGFGFKKTVMTPINKKSLEEKAFEVFDNIMGV